MLKTIMGKSLNEEQFKEFLSYKDNDLRKKILDQFNENRYERTKIFRRESIKEIEKKRILLQSIDMNWKSHIQYLEQLRQVVGLRSYGQRDPLIEYKKEAFDLFSNLLEKLKLDYIKVLMNLRVVVQPQEIKKDEIKKNDPKFIGKKNEKK